MSRRGSPVRRRAKKLFTVQQANQALPLVRRIVADLVAQHRELDHMLHIRKQRLSEGHGASAALDEDAARGARRLSDLIAEVGAIGCELKNWATGRVDFRAILDGREVYLCWMLGEDSIRYWHELSAGPTARQPLGASSPQASSRGTDSPASGTKNLLA